MCVCMHVRVCVCVCTCVCVCDDEVEREQFIACLAVHLFIQATHNSLMSVLLPGVSLPFSVGNHTR